jgi:hypothetical protein
VKAEPVVKPLDTDRLRAKMEGLQIVYNQLKDPSAKRRIELKIEGLNIIIQNAERGKQNQRIAVAG